MLLCVASTLCDANANCSIAHRVTLMVQVVLTLARRQMQHGGEAIRATDERSTVLHGQTIITYTGWQAKRWPAEKVPRPGK